MTERYTMTRRSMLIAVPAAAGIALLAVGVLTMFGAQS